MRGWNGEGGLGVFQVSHGYSKSYRVQQYTYYFLFFCGSFSFSSCCIIINIDDDDGV